MITQARHSNQLLTKSITAAKSLNCESEVAGGSSQSDESKPSAIVGDHPEPIVDAESAHGSGVASIPTTPEKTKSNLIAIHQSGFTSRKSEVSNDQRVQQTSQNGEQKQTSLRQSGFMLIRPSVNLQISSNGNCDVPVNDRNVATSEHGAEVIITGRAKCPDVSIIGNLQWTLLPYGHYQSCRINDGNIMIQLGKTCMLGSLKLVLHRYTESNFYNYYVEMSTDGESWEKVIDNTNSRCCSVQDLVFKSRPVKYIKITGTYSSHSEVLAVAYFQCPSQSPKYNYCDTFTDKSVRIFDEEHELEQWGLAGRTDIYIPRKGVNVATVEDDAEVIVSGDGVVGPQNCIINGSDTVTNGSGIQGVDIGGSIVVRLGRIYVLDSLQFALWATYGVYYHYYIEMSIDGEEREMVIDKRVTQCRSFQDLHFTQRAVKYIRIVGTHKSSKKDSSFQIISFQCPLWNA
ncbi:hypothetical protein QR680_014468 [Steinernema hermaphroditum]|uniref:F5/8 type C domain-containing protein n=1 Tax=Steinernema hermaphroditum TaxID=289476 RepID=A0AA39IB98_9BILA|nr:hypothetical protein QR680_014468 [Steinernema hermaphroditum]